VTSPGRFGLAAALGASLVAGIATGAEELHVAPLALVRLDFVEVPDAEDRQAIKKAVLERLPKNAITLERVPELTGDRDRIELGKRLAVRLLFDGSVGHEPGAGGQMRWWARFSLFDVDGGAPLALEEMECPGCTRDAFVQKLPELVARLMAHDKRQPTALLRLDVQPAGTECTLSIDDRAMGRPPFTERLFAGTHRITVEADGFKKVTREVTLTRGKPTDVTIRLEPVEPEPVAAPVRPGPEPVVRKRSPAAIAAGAVLLTLGIGGIIAGAAILPLDGEPACDRTPEQVRCPERYATGTGGAALIGVGAAAVVGGAAALIADAVRRRRVSADVARGRLAFHF
jgi:hypothetical protein